MAKVLEKVQKVGSKLWEHKKKTAFAGFLGYLGVDYLVRWNLNQKIRAVYARQALAYGEQTISPELRPRRIFALVNVEGNNRHCFDDFQKNALPLFHLAGIQVDVVKADNESQLEALAGAVDAQEADVMFIVGGDGTIGTILTGIFRNRTEAPLPIGCFPGGYDNIWLKRMASAVFEKSSDVRSACESAMAVIEGQPRPAYVCEISNEADTETSTSPRYALSGVSAGWFAQIEDKRKKLWYFGSLKRRWAYIWEMIKRSPTNLEASIEYEEPCSGCERCRPKPVYVAPTWRWWHILTGTPRIKSHHSERDFTGVVNEKCGLTTSAAIRGTEFLLDNVQVENENGNYCLLQTRMGGDDIGRFGVIAEGWRRCSQGRVGSSDAEGFYATDILAQSVVFRFSEFPEYVRRLYVSSNVEKDDVLEKNITVKATRKKVDLFLPSNIRVDLAHLE